APSALTSSTHPFAMKLRKDGPPGESESGGVAPYGRMRGRGLVGLPEDFAEGPVNAVDGVLGDLDEFAVALDVNGVEDGGERVAHVVIDVGGDAEALCVRLAQPLVIAAREEGEQRGHGSAEHVGIEDGAVLDAQRNVEQDSCAERAAADEQRADIARPSCI